MRRILLWVLGGWVITGLLLGSVVSADHSRELTVHFFDIGQGDAALIDTPSGQQVLIDGGPDKTVVQKVGSQMPFFDHTIELVLLTHPHADHVNGLVEILRQYHVERVVMSGALHDAAGYKALLAEIDRQHIPVSYAKRGDHFDLGQDTRLAVLAPPESCRDKAFTELHESTVVTRLTYGATAVLLTGDVNGAVEREMLAAQIPVAAQVLKVSHHGSRYSTTPDFLKAVNPSIAVISVGEGNRYHHPHQELLDRLTAYPGLTTYRTDQDGDVTVRSDGKQVTATTEREHKL